MLNYTTTELVFALGDTKAPSAAQSVVMDSVVEAISRQLDRYLNQVFAFQSYTDEVLRAQIDADGILQCWPAVPTMNAPSKIEWRNAADPKWTDITSATYDLIENTSGCQFRILSPNYLYYRTGRRFQMRLSFTGGWTTLDSIPADFEYGARRLAWIEFKKREQGEQGKTAIPSLGVITTPTSWPPDIKRVFTNFKRWNT